MRGRSAPASVQPGFSLPAFEKSAPPPPPGVVAARIDQHSSSGDVVADLFGRGGWVARAAVDRQRRAVSLESTPLTRMLAEVVLRPPDVRHLDAAFQGMAASPRRESSLKVSLGDLYATRCATCGRMLVVDEIVWGLDEGVDATTAEVAAAKPVARHYRCTVCRDQRGGSEQRSGPLDDDDLARTAADVGVDEVRASLRGRFAPVDGAESLVDELLASTRRASSSGWPRSSTASRVTFGPPRSSRRSGSPSCMPSCRPAVWPSRTAASRTCGSTAATSGCLRRASGASATRGWRSRTPFRLVRGFVQRLEGGALGPLQARLGGDLRSLGEGTATAVLALSSPSGLRVLDDEPDAYGRGAPAPHIRLILGQPPLRPSLERLASPTTRTSWVLGRDAASLLPIDALAGSSLRAPWSWQAVTIGRALEAAAPAMARDGRAVLLADSGTEGLAAAVLGGASAGYRLVSARLADGDDEVGGSVEFLPPGATRPPAPRTRSTSRCPRSPAAPATRTWSPDRACSRRRSASTSGRSPPRRPRARSPTRRSRPFGPGASRPGTSGCSGRSSSGSIAPGSCDGSRPRCRPCPRDRAAHRRIRARGRRAESRRSRTRRPIRRPRRRWGRRGSAAFRWPRRSMVGAPPDLRGGSLRIASAGEAAPDPVDRLLALDSRRADQARQAPPGRDRAGPLVAGRPEGPRRGRDPARRPRRVGRLQPPLHRRPALGGGVLRADRDALQRPRPARRGPGPGLPRELSQPGQHARPPRHRRRPAAPQPGAHGPAGDPRRRRPPTRHAGLARPPRADPPDGTGRCSATCSTTRERRPTSAASVRPVEDLAERRCIWYVRGKVAFLFEVEWTAMLGEPLLRRHARIPPDEVAHPLPGASPRSGRSSSATSSIGRRCCGPPSRTGTGTSSSPTTCARSWRRDPLDLADLRALSGSRARRRARGEQMPLFGG